MGILRLLIQRRGECYPLNHSDTMSSGYTNGTSNYHTNSYRPSNIISQIKGLKELSSTLTNYHHHTNSSSTGSYLSNKPLQISYPEDFRPVSAIIDVDILPDTYRRVRLHKHKSSKPLGFYIRDGRSLRVTPQGVEQVPGIFISRLMPGGLAESTGLLSVNDEVIEVNGIEVAGKTLDQVTDMMVANSSNLIITVKPTNQRYNLNRSQNTTPSNLRPPQPVHQILNKNSQNRSSSIGATKVNDAQKQSSSTGSSVNSSFSSANQIKQQELRYSFKSKPTNSNPSTVDSEQITIDLKKSHINHQDNDLEIEEEVDDEDDDDDEEDDEEIHIANNHQNTSNHNHHNTSSDHDSSDDKILTL